MPPSEFISAVRRLVYDLPDELAAVLADACRQTQHLSWPQRRDYILKCVPHLDVAHQINSFLNHWEQKAPLVSPESVALAILAAADMETHIRSNQQIELVWTGPDSQVVPLRRTDQVLLQVIQSAQERLHIVSFAVYNIASIAEALVAAANRGVQIALYLETPSASEGKIAYSTLQSLGSAVLQQAAVYVWPKEKRPTDEKGKHGSLHAKFAVTDGTTLLISSANLTHYAMTLNMELGILIRGGNLPGQMEKHLNRLIEQQTFRKLTVDQG